MKNVSRALCSTENSQQAFTLVELLAVVAAVLVLMGITFGVSRGVLNQQARTQAKAELAMIAQALE
ncbi:MAG: prepilin-type N-terminal cleavage/methylation domain-containing protein, partial [Lentimonas sp.]